MTDRELMQMALDALIETVRLAGEYGTHLIRNDKDAGHAYETIEALRARLAQSEPDVGVCCQEFDKCLRSCTPRGQWIAHKAAQREWQGLTDEERTFIAWESNNGPECVAMTEAKLKEKNT